VFVLIDWADVLNFERRPDGRLQRHDLADGLPEDDLSLRAARLLQQESGTSLGVDITLDKRLPWGAGMGGGSSDAASTLLALNRLWGLGWSRERLLDLGARLGADVPFFIGGKNAFVEGIGERLTPIDVPTRCYAVVKPTASIATADIFGHPGLVRNTETVILAGYLADNAKLASLTSGTFGRNDLQPPAEDRCPEVAQAARWLKDRFGNSRMTGSGSAVFAEIGADDQPMATWPQELPAGWVGRMCRGLACHPLVGWAAD
jgi:4-diphosphocytidyl-2-C-methyl-D-erythritol kinase